ncbi:MAG: hypothetical protein ACP5JH_09375 [Bacteroidota bacterium]
MSTILDLIGATVIGMLLLLSAFRFWSNMSEEAAFLNQERIVQSNVTALAEVFEHDLRKIGYLRGSKPDPAILTPSDSTHLTFLADLNDDGTIDTVKYFLGPLGEVPWSPSHPFRILYRQVKSANPYCTDQPVGSHLGLSHLHFGYYKLNGDTAISLGDIKIIEVTLKVENPYAYASSDRRAVAFWQQKRLTLRNLRR